MNSQAGEEGPSPERKRKGINFRKKSVHSKSFEGGSHRRGEKRWGRALGGRGSTTLEVFRGGGGRKIGERKAIDSRIGRKRKCLKKIEEEGKRKIVRWLRWPGKTQVIRGPKAE